jgi:hypothetical protein
MMLKKTHRLFQNLIILGLTGYMFVGCGERSMDGMIIMTRVNEPLNEVAYASGSSSSYLPESSIVALDPEKPDAKALLLSEGFHSICAPELSNGAERIIFAGQKSEGEIWQIWEMDLASLEARQVTSSAENCIDPTYLPGERILFGKQTRDAAGNTVHALFTCNMDGSELKQITFNPNDYFASYMLKDGRVLSKSKEIYPKEKEANLMVLRPDGTKAELFYQGDEGTKILSGGVETNNGKIIMIEAHSKDLKAGKLIAIDYNRPMQSKVELSEALEGSFKSVRPQQNGRLLVAYKSPEDETFGLYEFNSNSKVLDRQLYQDNKFNVVEAFLVEKRERPKKIPSEVNMHHDSGLLLCQDIDFSGYDHKGKDEGATKAVQIEFLGLEASMGKVAVEKDGSVYLKIAADTPFQIQTLDEYGNIVQGPGSWIYIRPNERRGCVGCHQGNEMVPENRQPLAVLKEPIMIPQSRELIVESKVESEKK